MNGSTPGNGGQSGNAAPVHASDCATNSAPAFPPGPCNCGGGTTDVLTIPAREIRYGDDLFGAGRVRQVKAPLLTVYVRAGESRDWLEFDLNEEVTVRRGGVGPCPACGGPHDSPCLALPPEAFSFDWTDCTDSIYAYGSIARGGGGYWPCMVNIVIEEFEGNITADDARRLAAVLVQAADECDKATAEEAA